MSEILALLKTRLNTEWMIGCDHHYFYDLTQSYVQQFLRLKSNITSPRIFLAQSDYQHFLSAFLAGVITDCHLFLGNYQWTKKKWEQTIALVKPHLVLEADNSANFLENDSTQDSILPPINFIMIPTGGTSGNIRFVIHTWETLEESVKGFREFFGVKNINSFCVLPLYHVSGLMQFMRSFLMQGNLIIFPYSNLKKNIIPSLIIQDYFISLVPTQLQHLLILTPTWLTQFKTILLGGAPPWNSLLEMARAYQLNLAPTYGMTETASQVVTLKPQDFLQGNYSTGKILPHAEIKINQTNKVITIKAKSLYLGYYPNLQNEQFFITDDLGYFDESNYLYIIGRNSQKIITGGENVFPREVENAILATGLVKDVSVIGIPDKQWGEVVTALFTPQKIPFQLQEIQAALQTQLSRFKHPKHWIEVKCLPRNQQGKLNYQILQKIAQTYLEQ